MRVVVAIGGSALLKRGQPMTAEVQRANVRVAAEALADLARDHEIVVAHGNGPQVGLLALQAAAYKGVEPYPLDIISAESVGMIGYLLEQEMVNAMPPGARCATLLTQIEVDPDDPAFKRPRKTIGPLYDEVEAHRLRDEKKWPMCEESAGNWRRVVPSPTPRRIIEIGVIRLLVEAGVTVICAGGGGIPVVRNCDGELEGVEAVIDKDHAAGLLASEVEADAFLMLTNVEAVFSDWGTPAERPIRETTPVELSAMTFAADSMGPKVEAACAFAAMRGKMAGIGRLQDARAILEGRAGTRVRAS